MHDRDDPDDRLELTEEDGVRERSYESASHVAMHQGEEPWVGDDLRKHSINLDDETHSEPRVLSLLPYLRLP